MILRAASRIFSILASEMPLMAQRDFLVCIWMPFTVAMPADLSFAMSAALIPCCCSSSMLWKKPCSTVSGMMCVA